MTKAERCKSVFEYDSALWAKGLDFAGIDEAGRGPLCGNVVAACAVMPKGFMLPNILDSKQLSEKQREAAYSDIVRHAVFWGVGQATVEEIDILNILEATKLAMRRAAKGAPVNLFLIDAVKTVGLMGEERPIISGDAISYSIAAASILAKVTRDRELVALDALYPQYGFSRHKGYGTAQHIAAIREFGPCPEHRMSFLGRILQP